MKSLLEFKSITEEEKADYSKFDALIRAGLANKAQVQRIHKILDKMGEERPVFNNADRAIMQNLFIKMVDLISNNKQIFTQARRAVREEIEEGVIDTSDYKIGKDGRKVKAHRIHIGKRDDDAEEQKIMEEPLAIKDPPNVLLLKRITTRMFPDGTKVALYYNKLLDKHFTIPYGPGVNAPLQAEEVQMSAFDSLQMVLANEEDTDIIFGNEYRTVSLVEAESLIRLYNKLSEENKHRMINQLDNLEMFDKFTQYALNQ
jgi:hypothetical protein